MLSYLCAYIIMHLTLPWILLYLTVREGNNCCHCMVRVIVPVTHHDDVNCPSLTLRLEIWSREWVFDYIKSSSPWSESSILVQIKIFGYHQNKIFLMARSQDLHHSESQEREREKSQQECYRSPTWCRAKLFILNTNPPKRNYLWTFLMVFWSLKITNEKKKKDIKS